MTAPLDHPPASARLYVQVLVAIAIGCLLGFFAPSTAVAMKPLGDGFIKLIKMLIAPIVFTTVVVGIAKMGEMKDVAELASKALVYSEVVSTLALVIGLIVVNLYRPGRGDNADPASLDSGAVASYTGASQSLTTIDFLC